MLLLAVVFFVQDSQAQKKKASGKELPKRIVPDYSTTPRKDIPYQYTWKTEDLYPTLEDWKKDKDAILVLIGQIDKQRVNWTASAQSIAGLFELNDAISIKAGRLFSFAANLADVDMGNSSYRAIRGELQTIFTEIGTKLAFQNPDLLAMDETMLRSYIATEPRLKPYKFTIEEILRTRAHILPEAENRIVSMTGLFSGTAQQASEALNNVDIPNPEITLSDGKKVVLNMSNFQLYRKAKNPKDRLKVQTTFWANRKKYENTFAILFDGGMKQHLFASRVQKYGDCLSAALDNNAIDTAVYHQLIRDVNANLEPLYRFYRLRKQLLGLDTMRYDDIFTSSVKSIDREYSWDEAKEIVLTTLKPLGAEYQATLNTAFNDRWIDIYPNKDKQYGAYSRSTFGIHPYVKMNYDGMYDNVSTLAHELGHSVHSYFAQKTQPNADASYPIFLAEIASTFNENLLINYMLKNEKDDLFKLYLLDSYLEQLRGTLYHQTMFADFELGMHRRLEDGKTLTAEWMNRNYLATLRRFYGHDAGVMVVADYFQIGWSSVPHFFYNFYVFQYSTGIIASLALSEKVLNETEKDVENYLTLLKSGGKDHPITLLKAAGVDMTTSEPAKAAFKRFSDLVGEMEQIVARLKAAKKI
jgi:oligoendopeptidase F